MSRSFCRQLQLHCDSFFFCSKWTDVVVVTSLF
jgi:hypothetical protein